MKIERATLLRDHANDSPRHGQNDDAHQSPRPEPSTAIAADAFVTISLAARTSFERELVATAHLASKD